MCGIISVNFRVFFQQGQSSHFQFLLFLFPTYPKICIIRSEFFPSFPVPFPIEQESAEKILHNQDVRLKYLRACFKSCAVSLYYVIGIAKGKHLILKIFYPFFLDKCFDRRCFYIFNFFCHFFHRTFFILILLKF